MVALIMEALAVLALAGAAGAVVRGSRMALPPRVLGAGRAVGSAPRVIAITSKGDNDA